MRGSTVYTMYVLHILLSNIVPFKMVLQNNIKVLVLYCISKGLRNP